MPAWLEYLISACLLIGASFALVGSIGLMRLPDFYLLAYWGLNSPRPLTGTTPCFLQRSLAWFLL